MKKVKKKAGRLKKIFGTMFLIMGGMFVGGMAYIIYDVKQVNKEARLIYNSIPIGENLFRYLETEETKRLFKTSNFRSGILWCTNHSFSLRESSKFKEIEEKSLKIIAEGGECPKLMIIVMRSGPKKFIFDLKLDNELKIVEKSGLGELD